MQLDVPDVLVSRSTNRRLGALTFPKPRNLCAIGLYAWLGLSAANTPLTPSAIAQTLALGAPVVCTLEWFRCKMGLRDTKRNYKKLLRAYINWKKEQPKE